MKIDNLHVTTCWSPDRDDHTKVSVQSKVVVWIRRCPRLHNIRAIQSLLDQIFRDKLAGRCHSLQMYTNVNGPIHWGRIPFFEPRHSAIVSLAGQFTAFLILSSHQPTPYSAWYTRFGFLSDLLVPRRSRLGPATSFGFLVSSVHTLTIRLISLTTTQSRCPPGPRLLTNHPNTLCIWVPSIHSSLQTTVQTQCCKRCPPA